MSGRETLHPSAAHDAEPQIVTTRAELFQRLILNTKSGYVITEGEYGPGRKYHKTVGDLMDAFWAFCDEKEAACAER